MEHEQSSLIEIEAEQAIARHTVTPRRAEKEDSTNLDFLRSLAVCLVFVNHAGPPLGVPGVAALGHLGVLLFFVHTALVLVMSMERLRLSGTALYSAFMIRRVFRIYPLSIVCVAAMLCLSIPPDAWASTYQWPGWATVFSNLALMQNITGSVSINGVLWSLPYEVQMYALLPVLFLWLRRAASLRAALAGWLVAAVMAVGEYFLRGGGQELEPRLLARYFPCFMGGLLAWQVLKRWPPRVPGWLWPICLFAFVAAYRFLWAIKAFGFSALLDWTRLRGPRLQQGWPLYVDIIIEGLLCALVGLAIPWFREIRSRWLKTATKLIARYSYGIYLSHSPAIWLCFGVWNTGSKALNLAGSVLVTAAISTAAYHIIENPCIRLGKRIATGGRCWPLAGD